MNNKTNVQHETVYQYSRNGESHIASTYEEAEKLSDKGTGPGYINPQEVPFLILNNEKIYVQHDLGYIYFKDGVSSVVRTYEEAAKLSDMGAEGPLGEPYIHPTHIDYILIENESSYHDEL